MVPAIVGTLPAINRNDCRNRRHLQQNPPLPKRLSPRSLGCFCSGLGSRLPPLQYLSKPKPARELGGLNGPMAPPVQPSQHSRSCGQGSGLVQSVAARSMSWRESAAVSSPHWDRSSGSATYAHFDLHPLPLGPDNQNCIIIGDTARRSSRRLVLFSVRRFYKRSGVAESPPTRQ
jgi:hypothetical protein